MFFHHKKMVFSPFSMLAKVPGDNKEDFRVKIKLK